MRASLTALPRLTLAMVLCLSLAGCFDYEVELGLTRPGKGYLDVRLSLPAHLVHGYPVGQLDTIVLPQPVRKMENIDGCLVISERCEFSDIDELTAHRVLFDIVEIGTGLLGVTDYTYRLTARLEMAEGDLPDRDIKVGAEYESRASAALPEDPGEERASQLLARSLGNHYLSMGLRVPGRVTKPHPLIIGASRIEGTLEEDGGLVKWRVPLAVLVAENARNTLVFSTEFKGNFTFRAYMRKDAKSHYPDLFDEGLAEGKDMGARVRQNRTQQRRK